jgi:hypothetical protein
MSESRVKIIGLKISGIRKIAAIEMQLDEKGLIPIIGKNQQGKSTILDSVESLFSGKKAVSDGMVKHGLSKGVIEAEIKDGERLYTVERVVKEDGSTTLKVYDKDGNSVKKPQEFLSGLINDLTFDPQPFLSKTTAEKLKFFLQLLKIDFSEENKQIENIEKERLFLGREIKNIGEIVLPEKVDPIDVGAKMAEFKSQQQYNNEIELKKAKFVQDEENKVAHDKSEKEAALVDFRKVTDEITRLKAELERLTAKKDKLTQIIHLPEYVAREIVENDYVLYDLTLVEKELSDAAEINKSAAEYQNAVAKDSELKEKEQVYKDHSERLKSLKAAKIEKLTAAKMPIEGLEIVVDHESKPDGVYFNGNHCDNWSDSESVAVSLKLCAAMNPRLRAVFIDRGESFDSDGLKMLKSWSEENDIQAIITIVDDVPIDDEMEAGVFYIEEGKLKAVSRPEPINPEKPTPEIEEKQEKLIDETVEEKLFVPSNGNEGMNFESAFCEQCQNEDESIEKYCEIHTRAIAGLKVPEWVYNTAGEPVCRKFVKN